MISSEAGTFGGAGTGSPSGIRFSGLLSLFNFLRSGGRTWKIRKHSRNLKAPNFASPR